MIGDKDASQSGGVNIEGAAGSVGGDIVGRDKLVFGPSMAEIEAKEARDRLRKIISQFDRRAVRDQMHEELIFFMLQSLRELRSSIQKMGINTIADPITRLLLTEIREEIEEIEDLGSWIQLIRPENDWPDSFLDYRIFGHREDHEDGTQVQRGNPSLRSRLSEASHFCHSRISNRYRYARNVDQRQFQDYLSFESKNGQYDLDRSQPVNVERLAKDVFCMYLFGRIDQLKDRISAKLLKINL
jgi:hypothetical protein